MKKKTNDAIKSEINAVYGDQAPWLSTIKYWTAEFKRGRTCIYDVDRPGRPIEATTQEIDDKIHDLVLDEPKTIVRELAGTVHISTERVLNILHEHLGMRKKRLLTIDQKRIRVRMFQDYLAIFNCNSSESPWMKFGSIIIHLRWHNSRNNGFHPVKALRSVQERNNGQAK